MTEAQPSKAQPPPNRRRDKPQLSCNLCRKRKLKCDRGQPCGTCNRLGLSDSCIYVTPNPNVSTKAERSQGHAALASKPARNIPDRIEQLESLVTTMIGSRNNARPTDGPNAENDGISEDETLIPVPDQNTSRSQKSQDPPEISESFGRISLQSNETSYVDSTHWTAVLESIAELKGILKEEENFDDGNDTSTWASPSNVESDFLFGRYERATREQILATLPPKLVVDQLLTDYFLNKALAPTIIHYPTFLREYNRFWAQQSDTSIVWIGELFAVMSLGAHYQQEPLPFIPNPKSLIPIYREKSAQCLVIGKYMKCPPHTIETLLMHLHLAFTQNESSSQMEFQTMLGSVVRLGLRMGFHRDPSHFPEIPPFEGEMRRRVWARLISLDALGSAQVGLPRMIRESHCDTAEPKNYLDEDLYEGMPALPESRPDTVESQVQYMVAKNRITAVYAKITDEVTAIQPISYTEILRLDKVLVDTYATVPLVLQMRPMNVSLVDAPGTILHRISIAVIFHKSKCVLHYRYMIPSRTDLRYVFSRSACIESSLELLEYQTILDEETRPGRKLHQDRWKVSQFITDTFFLATSLLCLEIVKNNSTAEASTTIQETPVDTGTRDKILQALRTSHSIWLKSSDESREARKAAEVLKIVLAKNQSPGVESEMTQNAASGGITDAGIGTSDENLWLWGIPTLRQIRTFNKASATAQPSTIHQLLRADVDYSNIQPEPADLTESLEDMLGMSPFSPGSFDVPME